MQQYRRDRHTVSWVNYHLLWVPKRRKKVLVGEIEKRLKEIIWEVCQENNWNVVALEIMPDHLHLYVNVPPATAPHTVVKAVKARSSRILRQEFPQLLKLPSLWTHSYFASTSGSITPETVQQYMEELRQIDTT